MGSKLNFCANISFLFTEHENVVDRYEVAKKFGFRGVEMLFPYSMELDELVKAKEKAGIEQILICSYPGALGKGEFGLAAIPGRENDFITAMNLSVQYAKELNCKRIHIMSGILGKNTCKEKGLMTLENNLRKIIPLLEKNNIVGLIEPINKTTIPGYFLNDFDTAISIVKSIQSPTIRLQLDIFHLQFIHGDLTRRVKEALPITGHIQVAQAPHRHELDSPGEIDYHYVLELLRDEGYKGWIGLEYAPSGGNN
jgi:hydroxypyruvate isomerase